MNFPPSGLADNATTENKNNNNDNLVDSLVHSSDSLSSYFKIRTITCFIALDKNDFIPIGKENTSKNMKYDEQTIISTTNATPTRLDEKIKAVAMFLQKAVSIFTTSSDATTTTETTTTTKNNHDNNDSLSPTRYIVQTTRIATNPFGEWLMDDDSSSTNTTIEETCRQKLQYLDSVLQMYNIEFCSLGPGTTVHEIDTIVPIIIQSSHRFSCSAMLKPNDMETATCIAKTILTISRLGEMMDSSSNTTVLPSQPSPPPPEHIQNGLGNFRFCCSSENTKSYIPFFPVAKAESTKNRSSSTTETITKEENDPIVISFAVGFENGRLLNHIVKDKCNYKMSTNFQDTIQKSFMEAYEPIHRICEQLESVAIESETTITKNKTNVDNNDATPKQSSSSICIKYVGIDTSINPSLETKDGSIAATMERMDCVNNHIFGSPGTIAVAAAMTQAIQSMNNNDDNGLFTSSIKLCGYCGLMLPLCEDERLAELAIVTRNDPNQSMVRTLTISDLLNISNVCGVGIDTVPIPGDTSIGQLCSILLDVTAIAHRWDKSLSCRVLPIPNKIVGQYTNFESSPYMVNTMILPLH